MNFVIFSYDFLPDSGAESWCSSRFAGALAQCGHNVHVVTVERPGAVSKEIYDLIVGPNVRVTRVSICPCHKPVIARARYLTFEWEAVNFSACISAVRNALREMPDAVLVTRSNPLASTIVGWNCRAGARKWVAHLSDPIPIPGREENWRCLHGHVNRFWMRRALRDADVISVTCPNAVRAYRDAYGDLAARARFIVTPHIGEPVLPRTEEVPRSDDGVARIVHHGVMCAGRGAPELADAVKTLNAQGVKCAFVQCGQVDDVTSVFDSDPHVHRAEKCVSDIEYIPDLMVPLSYCPFLSSKFVYRIFDDMPILLKTRTDSFSALLARQFPNSGIVTIAENDDFVVKLKEAIALTGRHFDRSALRKLFSREEVVNGFISVV